MSPRSFISTSITALALATMTTACANKPTAEATAETPGQDGSVATYASTDPDHEWTAVGFVTVEDDGADAEAPPSDGSEEKPTTPRITRIEYIVEPTLLDACGLTKPELYFETDSDEVSELGEIRIERVADCLDHPALADKDISIVGHADQRGPSDYNYELGLDRAESVAAELASLGIDRERLETTSRGERLADDPEHWDDRVVLIRLSN